jgi:16S rRNA C967 or C1407 C5-methylase (RsmB/RsmF family)
LKVSDVVEAFVQDGTKIKFEGIFQQRSFDKILLDAPCSALGQRPQFLQEKKLKELWSYSNLQKKLFAKAVDLLKIGKFIFN